MGTDHPIAWCQNFEGGRSWYEGAGHVDSAYTDPLFLDHLLGGIEWTAGVVEGGGNCVTFKEVNGHDGRHTAAVRILEQAEGKASWASETGSRCSKNFLPGSCNRMSP